MRTLSKFWPGVSFYKRPVPGILAAIITVATSRGTAPGDTLEMKIGQIVQGKVIGGSTMNIRFQVDGQEQIFATKEVLNIGFSDTSDGSNAAAPPAQPAVQAPPSAPDAISAPTRVRRDCATDVATELATADATGTTAKFSAHARRDNSRRHFRFRAHD